MLVRLSQLDASSPLSGLTIQDTEYHEIIL